MQPAPPLKLSQHFNLQFEHGVISLGQPSIVPSLLLINNESFDKHVIEAILTYT
ncbi:hypothetical protein AF72_06135 [Xylella taiwanensis]|uniref:Uncharacterized protein n=1 Tax=Xylella taiwanensis TaxID=1444770 RepID=Z9JKI2_9GAMM|nr:hypothetical protein AF72_06135 [Xylella taiwanensis]